MQLNKAQYELEYGWYYRCW